jgi:hypothetical protein
MTPLYRYKCVYKACQGRWVLVEGEAGSEVAVGAFAADGSVEHVEEGIEDHADSGAFVDYKAEGDADIGESVDEVCCTLCHALR